MTWFWQRWGITARLLAAAVLPAAFVFAAVTTTLYVTARNDVRRDVSERGRLIATALAQSSQYGLMSGNAAYLHTTVSQLLEADPSIACIEVIDTTRRPVVSKCQPQPPVEQSMHEVPVRIESLPEVDLLDPAANGDVQAGAAHKPHSTRGADALRTIGYIRVAMSPSPIFGAKLHAVLTAMGLVLAATILSGLVGLRLTRRLRHTLLAVMTALRRIRQGRFDVQLDTHQDGELGELQRTIVEMASNLHVALDKLEHEVATRTQELSDAVALIKQADAEKRRLIVHSNALIEEDRRRIALELHDHLGASLISVRLEAAALVAAAESLADADMARGARRIASTAEALYASTRNIVKSLRPEVIDTLGLAGAIEDLVRGYDQLSPACHIAFHADPSLPDLRGEQAMPAYRVTQEALTNLIKHAQASHASVALSVSPDGRQLHIDITDNGKGFDTHVSQRQGLGLIGMRERMAAAGGDIKVRSAPGEGTMVSLSMPIPQPPAP